MTTTKVSYSNKLVQILISMTTLCNLAEQGPHTCGENLYPLLRTMK